MEIDVKLEDRLENAFEKYFFCLCYLIINGWFGSTDLSFKLTSWSSFTSRNIVIKTFCSFISFHSPRDNFNNFLADWVSFNANQLCDEQNNFRDF